MVLLVGLQFVLNERDSNIYSLKQIKQENIVTLWV